MNRNTKLMLCIIAALFFGETVVAQNIVFNKLKAKFDDGFVFEAVFNHNYYDSYTNESVKSEGHIWIEEQGYKLESDEQIVVVDGETSKVFDRSRNRIIISDYDSEEDDFAPSRMLRGADSTYTVTEEVSKSGNRLIVLETKDEFAAFLKVEIEVSADILPLSIIAYDAADNIITTTFSGGKFIKKEASVFDISYPEGAELIDMRN